MPSDDELAHTATAPARPAVAAAPLESKLGRYRLDRELGAGGMGVVHAAFDPDLERTVALKVLRHASDDASARLLREARAMAKLSHPNVITIFEVGTAAGRDYIAMELIDGETLAGWVRGAQLGWRAIVAAFVAAGRGLAAAHVAGLVHRDFKAQNVLRAKDGRILVTDFGLACATDEAVDSASRERVPSSPSDRSGSLTATGTLVGTPAYMAPEQWSGGAIGPATDQFAFCVGLWEAVAGERPFRGATLDELRAAVLAGPDKLDDERVPRPLRAILRRGLAIDPARRWPDMTSLLAALQRVLRRRRRIVGAAAVVALAGGTLALALMPRGAASAGCPPGALDPDQVWSARVAAELAARGGDGVTLLDHDTRQWREVRRSACAAPLAVRSTKLACLDGVMARIDATVRAVRSERGPIDGEAVAAELVEPSVCDRAAVPHLAAVVGPDLAEAFGLLRSAIVAEHDVNPTTAIAKLDSPCARAVALSAQFVRLDTDAPSFPDRVPALLRDEKELLAAAERCDDDAIKAHVSVIGADDPAALERAKQAVAVVTTPDLVADLDKIAGAAAREARRWDDAAAAFDRAIAAYGGRHRVRSQLGVVIDRVKGLVERGRSEDLDSALALDARWRPVAAELHDRTLGQLELHIGEARWRRGDVAGGDAALDAATARVDVDVWIPIDSVKPVDVTGEVVDETGTPVADATVTSALLLVADSTRLASPIGRFASRSARTDRDGRFALSGARSMIAAMRGDRRSSPSAVASHVRLVLHPTSRVSGKVELGAIPAGRIWVVAQSEEPGVVPSAIVAPVFADGSFAIDGIPRGRIAIGATEIYKYTFVSKQEGFAHVVVSAPAVDRLALALAAQRKLHVVARSVEVTPPDGAFVVVARGRIADHRKVLAELAKGATLHVAGVRDPATPLPEELRGHAEPDDMYTTFDDRAEGELTVCALGLSKRQMATVTEAGKLTSLFTDAEFACVVVEPAQAVVTIELPPIRRTPSHGEPIDAGR